MRSKRFNALVSEITEIGLEHHRESILENSRRNAVHVEKTLRDVLPDARPCLVVSAGPSLYRKKILHRLKMTGFNGAVVATDGAYIQCLKAGLTPDWVVTIDPHSKRIVRWFGDPDVEENSKGDDYFKRQDLDERFRSHNSKENEENIALVDFCPTNIVMASTAPANVVARTAEMERFWFAPLVDDPAQDGLTKTICEETRLPALNTGGTVGTAAWAFAQCILGSKNIAVVGMDFGYPAGTPLTATQEWNLLKDNEDVEDFYPVVHGHWGTCYTSPTYAWYLQNFLELLEAADARITNCSEGGILMGPRVDCRNLDEWLKSSS